MLTILDLTTLEPYGLVDDYISASWKRLYYGESSCKIVLHANSRFSSDFVKRRLVVMPDGEQTFMIEQVEMKDNDGMETVTVLGHRVGYLNQRLAIPPAGLSHDEQNNLAAETAMKHYVNSHCGPGADVARRVPRLTLATDLGRGSLITERARYRTIAETLERIGWKAGVGWDVTRVGDDFEFDVIVGVDRSATVFFDDDFDTLLGQEFLTSIVNAKTMAYVAGQGVGAARTIVTRHSGGSEPAGLDRREVFIDARDTNDNATLQARGESAIAESSQEDVFAVTYNPFGSFRYGVHWDLGDIVTARNRAWGVQAEIRVVSVEEISDSEGDRILVELGKPWPTVKDIIEDETEVTEATSYE